MTSMIDEAFEALRELVLDSTDCFDDKVVQIFKKQESLSMPSVDDKTCKLALLSAPIWAERADDHPSFLMEDFTELCQEVVDESLKEEGLSRDQLVVIGKALIEGNQSHGLLLNVLKKAERNVELNPTLENSLDLLRARLGLGLYDESLPCLDYLQQQLDKSKEHLVEWTMSLAQVLCERIPYRPVLGDRFPALLDHFAAAVESNQEMGFFEEEEVILYWIRCLKFYLYHLENCFKESQDQNESDPEAPQANHPDIAMNEAFVEAESETIWPLIELHDQLIVENADLFADPLNGELEPLQETAQDSFYEALEKLGYELDGEEDEPVE